MIIILSKILIPYKLKTYLYKNLQNIFKYIFLIYLIIVGIIFTCVIYLQENMNCSIYRSPFQISIQRVLSQLFFILYKDI